MCLCQRFIDQRLLASTNCQSLEFSSAVESALRRVIRLGIPATEQVVDVNVNNQLDNNCTFPFEVEIRKSVLCSETTCNTTEVGAEAAAISTYFCPQPCDLLFSTD